MLFSGDTTVLKQAKGWHPSELEQLRAETMDAARIRHLIANIEASISSIHYRSIDARKLQDLKTYFEAELKKRGQ